MRLIVPALVLTLFGCGASPAPNPIPPQIGCPPLTSAQALREQVQNAVWATMAAARGGEPPEPIIGITREGYQRLCVQAPGAVACAGGEGKLPSFNAVMIADQHLRARFAYRDDFVQWGQPDPWLNAVSCGDCFAEDERFWCYEGDRLVLKTIADMVVGTQVLSYDWAAGTYCRETVVAQIDKGKRDVVSLTYKNWATIQVTPDHNMWSRDRQAHDGYVKRRLSEFSRPHHYLTPFATRLPYPEVDDPDLTEDHCFLIGHFLAEGWNSDRHVCTSGYDIPEHIVPRLDDLGIPYTLQKNNSGVPYVNFLASPFKERIRALKRNSFDADLGDLVHLPAEKLLALVEGYWLGDGHLRHKSGGGGVEIYLSTSCDRLAEQFTHIHLKIGQPCYVYTQDDHGGSGDKPIHRLICNPRSGRHVERGSPGVGQLRGKVEDRGEVRRVWDVTVSRTHTFVHESGMLAHNCEDYALTLSQQLAADGVAGPAMTLMLWSPRAGFAHATLVVETSDAGFVEIGVNPDELPQRYDPAKGVRFDTIRFDGSRKVVPAHLSHLPQKAKP